MDDLRKFKDRVNCLKKTLKLTEQRVIEQAKYLFNKLNEETVAKNKINNN